MKDRLKNRLEALVRQLYVRTLSSCIPFYIINEYPKSGGTWIGQMLGEALKIEFPRHCMPSLRPSVMHGHYIHHWGINNAVCVWRDGRDVMVSWYHHCLFKHGFGNERLVKIVSKDLGFNDINDIIGNMPKFIEYAFSRQSHPNYSWTEFVRAWSERQDVLQVRYESFRKDGVGSLVELVQKLVGKNLRIDRASEIVDKYSFEKMSGRKAGIESKSSFMRKGVIGDWKSCFSRESKEVFEYYAGNELIRLGYENDNKWVRDGFTFR